MSGLRSMSTDTGVHTGDMVTVTSQSSNNTNVIALYIVPDLLDTLALSLTDKVVCVGKLFMLKLFGGIVQR